MAGFTFWLSVYMKRSNRHITISIKHALRSEIVSLNESINESVAVYNNTFRTVTFDFYFFSRHETENKIVTGVCYSISQYNPLLDEFVTSEHLWIV